MHNRKDTLTRIARNTLFVLFARGTDLSVALFSTMLIVRYLGITDFGYFALVTSISLFLGPVADFGFERIITREIAKNRSLAGQYVGVAIVTRIAFSLMILALLVCMTSLFVDWNPKVEQAVYLSTFAQLFTSMGMLAVGTFRAFERMEFELILNFVINFLYLGLLAAVIVLDGGFSLVFGARLIASLVQMVLLLSVMARKFVKPVFAIDGKLMRHLFTEAAPLGVFAILLTATFRVDVFVLNYYKGLQDVALFEAAHRIIMQLQVIPMSIVIALFPFLSMVAAQSSDALKDSFGRAFKIMLIISLPLPIVMTFAADAITTLLYGASFAPAAASLSILSWTLTFLFLILLQTFVITAHGRQGLNTVSAAIGFAANLLFALLLVPRYGYLGASYATLISYLLLFAISYYFLARTVGVPRMGNLLLKPLLAAAAMGIGAFLLSGRGNGLFVVAATGLLLLCYVVALYSLKAFSLDEIMAIKGLLARKKRREPRLEET